MKQTNSKNLPNSENPFKVPEQYFERFDELLFSKWHNKPTPPVKKSILKGQFTYIGVAASLAVLAAVTLWIKNSNSNHLSALDIENYLHTPSMTLPSEITQDFTEEDFKALEKSLDLNDLKIDDYLLSSTDIEYYLNE